jgi:hypothetical protein
MTPRAPMQLVDYIRELTEEHSHAEHYQVQRGHTWYGRNHVTKVPPLIAQLWANDLPSQSTETGMRPGFASKPAARLDALDAAARIDHDAQRWVLALGGRVEAIADSIDLVRRLNGLAASTDPATRADITRDVRSWWTQARIVTGWDSPAWAPDNTCPQCGERGTLKVRLAEGIGMCTNDACRVTWDTATIGLLADHIRAESEAEREPVAKRGPCWCPVPKPVISDLRFLCPACGSARCMHALELRLLHAVSVDEGRMRA